MKTFNEETGDIRLFARLLHVFIHDIPYTATHEGYYNNVPRRCETAMREHAKGEDLFTASNIVTLLGPY
jgi:hypothetical protein